MPRKYFPAPALVFTPARRRAGSNSRVVGLGGVTGGAERPTGVTRTVTGKWLISPDMRLGVTMGRGLRGPYTCARGHTTECVCVCPIVTEERRERDSRALAVTVDVTPAGRVHLGRHARAEIIV